MRDYDKRNYIRFSADPNELVTIYYLDENNNMTGRRRGLCQNESYKGCCVVFVGEVNFKNEQEVLFESCTHLKMKAKVAWIKKLEDQVTKIGFSLIV